MQNLKTTTNNLTDWENTTLGKVGKIITGNTPPTSNRKYYNDEYLPWITPPDLGDGIRLKGAKKYLSKAGAEVARVLPKGAVLISCIGNLGKIGIAETELATNQQINSVVFNDEVLPEYGFYYCLTLKNWLNENSSATTISIINKGRLENAPFLLTSIEKQQQIVDGLNAVVPNVPVLVTKIAKAKKLVIKFRQTILTAAITGKLTEDWQLKNLGTTRAQIDFVSLNKKRKVQFEMSHFQLFDIPEDWQWKQFWEVAEIKSNLVSPKEYPDYVLVAPDNIERNTGRLLEKKLVKEINPISAKHLFFKGQIVYSKIRPYLSKLIFANFDGLCSADMYPISPKIDVRYLMLFMLSKYFLETVSNIGTRTLLPKTNQEELNSIPVPVPSLEEQEEIVAKVDAYLEIADKVEKQIGKAEARVSKLTQAILAKTFRGNDE